MTRLTPDNVYAAISAAKLEYEDFDKLGNGSRKEQKMIDFTPGTTYDTAYLRPFDLELAKQGHPLALKTGQCVTHFREIANFEIYDAFLAFDAWDVDLGCYKQHETTLPSVRHTLRLAPLAVGDGRALHVGDEIEVTAYPFPGLPIKWLKATCTLALLADRGIRWRWPGNDAATKLAT